VKFALRRAPEPPATPEPDPLEVPPPPRPTPPPGAPVTAYAGLDDGRTLWLAIEAAAGTLAFRPAGGGEVVVARSDLAEDQPAYRSVRADLTDLLPVAEAAVTYDVVLVPPAGGEPQRVWSPPLDRSGPLKTPPTRDGRTRFVLMRTGPGFLQVRRTVIPPAAELRQVRLDGDGLVLDLDAPATMTHPSLLVLHPKAEQVVAELPLTALEGGTGWRGVLVPDAFSDDDPRALRVGVGTAGDWVAVRRRHNDLVDANASVLLPQVVDDESDRPRLRLRWGGPGGGVLQVRLPRPDGGADDPDEDTDEADEPDQDDTDGTEETGADA
jgi:hypothetical protein